MKPTVNGTADAKRAAKPTRRTRSPHPGVVLIAPDATHTSWRARYDDPDSGKRVKVRLDPVELSNATSRRHWAIRKSQALARRRVELDSGAPRATRTPLADALDSYYEAHPQLRPKTLTAYRAATDKLAAWCAGHGVRSADDLTRARLMDFRAALVSEPKRAPQRGSKGRGKRSSAGNPRSPLSVNRELRATRTVLGYLRDLDLFARLTHDDLRRALKRLPVTHERLEYLRPAELRTLLEAALRHDAETFELTREEHARGLRKGTTPRYDPIGPLIVAALLSGMRFGEAIALDWSHVDLHALDLSGREVGEIHLPGSTSKTHRARTVALEVSPALHRLLAALHLRAGGKGPVFRLRDPDKDGKPIAMTRGSADAAAKRLRAEYGAPKAFGWQALRRTCGTFLTNAPGIFGAASAYRSAKQLGHSVTVAERHYVDVARGIPREARTLEHAMQIGDLVDQVIASLGAPAAAANVRAIGGAR